MIQELGEPARLAGRAIGEKRHICAFFHSTAEKYDVLGSFILEGFRRGDHAVHVVDPERKVDHCRCLEHLGMPLIDVRTRSRLEVSGWDEAFLHGGRFRQWDTLSHMEAVFQRGAEAGKAIDILRAHPMALVGGILQENPFFASPAEFLDASEAAA